MIDALYEVSDPKHPEYVSGSLCFCMSFLTFSYPATKIRCMPVQETSRRSHCAASGHVQIHQFLARTPRGSLLFYSDHALQRLVNDLHLPLTKAQRTNLNVTQGRTRPSFTRTAMRCLLPCTSTCRPSRRRKNSVRHTQPPGKPRNWCQTVS